MQMAYWLEKTFSGLGEVLLEGQTGIIINTQVADGGNGDDGHPENGSNTFDLRSPYLQRIARPKRTRVVKSAANRRDRGTGARRPSTERSRPRTTNATKSKPATVENSSDIEENGDTQPSSPPIADPQDPATTEGPQTVE
ncbi:hypothetical protein GJ496_011447 [Pomphorhynchus laevis]|nr:hypothetical protein GJ496_011447 [Pomphorhynchus laevis]